MLGDVFCGRTASCELTAVVLPAFVENPDDHLIEPVQGVRAAQDDAQERPATVRSAASGLEFRCQFGAPPCLLDLGEDGRGAPRADTRKGRDGRYEQAEGQGGGIHSPDASRCLTPEAGFQPAAICRTLRSVPGTMAPWTTAQWMRRSW